MKIKKNNKNASFLLLLVLCVLFLHGCNNQGGQYTNVVIPDSLHTFFPKNDSLYLKLYSISTNARERDRTGESAAFLEAHFIKVYSCEHVTQFELLMHKYKQEAIDSLKPVYDNYFIIQYESDMLKMYDYKTLKTKYQESINKYILPSFHNNMRDLYGVNYNFTTICGLPEDYEVLIMKSGRDYVLPDNSAWKYDWKILPPELKHGYTSGIAYRNASDKIIYWCIAW